MTTKLNVELVRIPRHPPYYRASGMIASKKPIVAMTNRTVLQSDGGNHGPIITEGESRLHTE